MTGVPKPTRPQIAKVQRVRAALVGAAVVSALLVALFASARLYTRVFAPERRAAARPPATAFDSRAMRAATTPDAVQAEQAAILALGSRYLGQPGMYAAAQ